MADETYYSLLEVPETAPAAEIKTAYLRLIREVHPDRLANAPSYWQRQAEEKSKEINEAYEVLRDSAKRRLYDTQLGAYRNSQSTANRATTSRASTSSSASSTKHQSQSSSRTRSGRGNSSSSAQTPRSTSQTHQAASTSQAKGGSPTSSLSSGQRLFLASICALYSLAATIGLILAKETNDQVGAFLFATAGFSLLALIYKQKVGAILSSIGIKNAGGQFFSTIGVIVLILFLGKNADMNRDTHFRGPGTFQAANSQIAQVQVIHGSLSVATVSGRSNEKYSSAYNFMADLQNNSSVRISFIRTKIRIFDCPESESSSLHTSYGVTYQSGIFDPSPPLDCKNIGEEEEDDFPNLAPGQVSGFANFYFPSRPTGSLRWNYQITEMDAENVAVAAPTSRASDEHPSEQNLPDSPAPQTFTKSEPFQASQTQPLTQIPKEPNPQDAPQESIAHASAIAGVTEKKSTSMQGQAEAQWRKSLVGSWVGKYNCAQGISGVTLTIAETASGGLSGIFDFYPVPGGYQFQEGSYSGTLTVDTDGGFEFRPQNWISQPPGFLAVGLSGRIEADAQRLQGQVSGAPACASFDLSRRQNNAQPVAVKQDLSGLPALHDLSTLSADDRYSIESACSAAKTLRGPAAYHECLTTQLHELAPTPNAPSLSGLSPDDRYSIESACSAAKTLRGPAAYHECLTTQLHELARAPNAPSLSGLSPDDRYSIESACSAAKTLRGPAAYHDCLRSQLSQLTSR